MANRGSIGCQIAPHYEEQKYDSPSSSMSSLEGESSSREERENEAESDRSYLDKVETQRDMEPIRTTTRPTLQARTRSSTKEKPGPSVGFCKFMS